VLRGRRHLVPWVLLFAGSCAAPTYEIVWFQLLRLVVGSSAVWLGLLLAMRNAGQTADRADQDQAHRKGANGLVERNNGRIVRKQMELWTRRRSMPK
jgi:hypothetical protein